MLLDKEFSNVALISEKEKIFLHLRQQPLNFVFVHYWYSNYFKRAMLDQNIYIF